MIQEIAEQQALYTIESEVLFSRSMIWQLQNDYYKGHAINAWALQEIPNYITSNPVIGKMYAEVVFAMFCDIKEVHREKIYILELGAGHGKFSYHFLKHFDLLIKSSSVNLPQYCYVISDFSEENISFIENNPKMQKYISENKLDFSFFDAEKSNNLFLRRSKKEINTGDLMQPVIVIANYFFDVLRQDLYYIHDHKIQKCLLTIKTTDTLAENKNMVEMQNLIMEPIYTDLEELPYEEAYLNKILGHYSHELSDSHLLFPFSGIRCIEKLRQLSTGGLLLLTADKCYHTLEQLDHLGSPCLAKHNDSFSLMVNYHAFQKYCELHQGYSIYPDHANYSLGVECLLMTEHTELYRETKKSFKIFISDYGPEDYCNINTIITSNHFKISYSDIISILKMSHYDTKVFLTYLSAIHKVIPKLGEREKNNLSTILSEVWENYYPLEKNWDIAFEIGKLNMMMGYYRMAIPHFRYSIQYFGYHKSTVHNLLICFYSLRDYDSIMLLMEERNF